MDNIKLDLNRKIFVLLFFISGFFTSLFINQESLMDDSQYLKTICGKVYEVNKVRDQNGNYDYNILYKPKKSEMIRVDVTPDTYYKWANLKHGTICFEDRISRKGWDSFRVIFLSLSIVCFGVVSLVLIVSDFDD